MKNLEKINTPSAVPYDNGKVLYDRRTAVELEKSFRLPTRQVSHETKCLGQERMTKCENIW